MPGPPWSRAPEVRVPPRLRRGGGAGGSTPLLGTPAIFPPTGFAIDVKTGQQWEPRITVDEIKIVEHLCCAEPLPLQNENRQYLICVVVSGDNLGHTLWNVVSCCMEFILT